jgi:hypothetical protein
MTVVCPDLPGVSAYRRHLPRRRLRPRGGHALQLAQALLARAHALLGRLDRFVSGALRDQQALGVLRSQPLGEVARDLGEPRVALPRAIAAR